VPGRISEEVARSDVILGCVVEEVPGEAMLHCRRSWATVLAPTKHMSTIILYVSQV
jgi:hypothetical protein